MKLLTSLSVAFQALLLRLHGRLESALLPTDQLADQLAPASVGAAAQGVEHALHAAAAVGGDSIASLPRRARSVRSVRFDAAVPPTIDEFLRVAPAPPPPPRRAQLGPRWAYVAYFGVPCGGRAPSPGRYL